MRIGVARETKEGERRVALGPAHVSVLASEGHDVCVERGAGAGIGVPDEAYRAAGARIVAAGEAWSSGLVVKVKEVQPAEIALVKAGSALFGYQHLAGEPEMTRELAARGATAIAFELVRDERAVYPLLAPMSVIAGRMAVDAAARILGRGLREVLVPGAGHAGLSAARAARDRGARVTVLTRSGTSRDAAAASSRTSPSTPAAWRKPRGRRRTRSPRSWKKAWCTIACPTSRQPPRRRRAVARARIPSGHRARGRAALHSPLRLRIPMSADLAARIDDLLPQTQCTKCGYDGCRPYAQAIAAGEAAINHCPPGGQEGVRRLAELLGRAPLPLDPANGAHRAPQVAVIDEAACIGCTKCIQACPVDAIVGASKRMHTVIASWCTGCELCIPPCPVDCIALEPGTGLPPAPLSRARHELRAVRLARDEAERAARLEALE